MTGMALDILRNWAKEKSFYYKVAAVVAFIVASLAIMPWAPGFPNEALEPSWQLGMNYAAAARLRFGTDIVFTFGPFSAAYTRAYYPGTFVPALVINALLTALLIGGVARQLREQKGRIAAIITWGMLIVLSAAFYMKDAIFLMAPYIAFLCLRTESATKRLGWLSILSLIVLSAISLVKISFAIAALGVLLIFLIFHHGSILSRLIPILVYTIATVGLWLLSGQEIADLPRYIVASIPITTGYADAMSISGSPLSVVGYVVGGGLPLR